MHKSVAFIVLIGATFLSGCTELEVKRAAPGELIVGIPYALPKKTFVVSIAYELKECTNDTPLKVRVSKSVKVTPTTQPDETERYYIPYTSLRNWFKDTNITVESYDNQTLKGATAVVTDRTGDAITSVVSSAIKLGTFGTGAAPAALADTRVPRCNPEAVATLVKLAALRKIEKPTEEDTATIAELRTQLTHKEVVFWSPAKPKIIPDQKETPFTLETTISPSGLVGKGGKWITGKDAAITGDLRTAVQLTAYDTVTADATDLPSGFVLRQGPNATLRICEEACPKPKRVQGTFHTDESQVMDTTVHVIPQLGNYVGMPLKNRLFENQTLTITVSAEGAITKLGLQSNAVAVAALQNLGTNLDALSNAKQARDKAAAAAAAAEQSANKAHADKVAADNNAIAECLKAQQALRAAGGTVTGTCQ